MEADEINMDSVKLYLKHRVLTRSGRLLFPPTMATHSDINTDSCD